MSTTELESKCRELRQLQALIAEAEEEAVSIFIMGTLATATTSFPIFVA